VGGSHNRNEHTCVLCRYELFEIEYDSHEDYDEEGKEENGKQGEQNEDTDDSASNISNSGCSRDTLYFTEVTDCTVGTSSVANGTSTLYLIVYGKSAEPICEMRP
jgi:hypothetical protein